MALNNSESSGTLVDILGSDAFRNYNFSLLSATSLADHPQNLSAVPSFN